MPFTDKPSWVTSRQPKCDPPVGLYDVGAGWRHVRPYALGCDMSAPTDNAQTDLPIGNQTPLEPPPIEPSEPLDGERAAFVAAELEAIEWLRAGNGSGKHRAGCQCSRCPTARQLARAAIIAGHPPCNDPHCVPCWARREMLAGRL